MSPERLNDDQLNAFVDGELDVLQHAGIESRMADDETLRARVAGLRGTKESVRAKADYHSAPHVLRMRLASLQPAPPPDQRRRWQWSLPLVARRSSRSLMTGAALAVLFAWATTATLLRPNHDELVTQEVVGSHVRSTLANRLTDVASSDQHTVKPWLSSRLDFAPPVKDTGPSGPVLVGGRVDYIDGRPVAAVVFRQRQHVINLFIWPAADGDTPLRAATQRGFNVVHEVNRGMAYWAVSDLNREDLAALVSAQMSSAADR